MPQLLSHHLFQCPPELHNKEALCTQILFISMEFMMAMDGGPQAAEIWKERMHGVLAEEMSIAANSSPSHVEACMQTSFKRLDNELCGVCPHGSECPRNADSGSTSLSSSCREPLVLGSVGTTAVVAVVGANHTIVGNYGDSRAVLCRGGKAVPLSIDHKANRLDEVARIEAAGRIMYSPPTFEHPKCQQRLHHKEVE